MTARGYECYLRVFNSISFRRKDECFRTFFGHFQKITEMFRSYSNISKYLLRDCVTIALVIILVAMATPISSHVKDKNSIFTACDEYISF